MHQFNASVPGKIVWRARRGILELDCLLVAFINEHYSTFTDAEKQALENLLEVTDPELYDWVVSCQDSGNYQQHTLMIERMRSAANVIDS
tara:strand:- start:1145 stop:1414 length:270 start_codon:yes stop_codon:yes gene_type:complete